MKLLFYFLDEFQTELPTSETPAQISLNIPTSPTSQHTTPQSQTVAGCFTGTTRIWVANEARYDELAEHSTENNHLKFSTSEALAPTLRETQLNRPESIEHLLETGLRFRL